MGLLRTREGKRRLPQVPTKVLGLIVIAVVLLAGVGAFSKDRIYSYVSSGDTITAEFEREYKLVDFQGAVKLSGVTVGEVTGATPTENGTTLVSMRVNPGVLDQMGAVPTATIRPTLVVGGIYYVGLAPGGLGEPFPADGVIPLERTNIAVELDRVLTALTEPAQQGLQTTIDRTNATLAGGGRDAVKGLLREAPGTLRPAAPVLEAVNGTRPGTDLPELVSGLQRTAATLNREEGQFEAIIDGLARTSAALSASRAPVSESIRVAPETLRITRAGLADLQPTLDRLEDTAPKLRPAVQELDPLLAELDPVLVRARPVLNDLRELLRDARPLVKELIPTSDDLIEVFDDVRGPVLDRVNGPIIDTINNPWTGTGIYEGGGDDHTFYEETAFLAAVGADVFKFKDQNGGMARLMAGVGLNTPVGGRKIGTIEQLLEQMALQQPAGPQEGGRAVDGGVPGLDPIGPTDRPTSERPTR